METRKLRIPDAQENKSDPAAIQLVIFFMEGKFLEKLWCCVGEGI